MPTPRERDRVATLEHFKRSSLEDINRALADVTAYVDDLLAGHPAPVRAALTATHAGDVARLNLDGGESESHVLFLGTNLEPWLIHRAMRVQTNTPATTAPLGLDDAPLILDLIAAHTLMSDLYMARIHVTAAQGRNSFKKMRSRSSFFLEAVESDEALMRQALGISGIDPPSPHAATLDRAFRNAVGIGIHDAIAVIKSETEIFRSNARIREITDEDMRLLDGYDRGTGSVRLVLAIGSDRMTTDVEMAQRSGVPLADVRALIDALHFRIEGTNPNEAEQAESARLYPYVRADEHTVGTLWDPIYALVRLIDDTLRPLGPAYLNDVRAPWLEEEIARIMRGASKAYATDVNLKWRTPNHNGELDALTTWGPVGVRWQAKSPLNPRKHFDYVAQALQQHHSLRVALQSDEFRLEQPSRRGDAGLHAPVMVEATVTLQSPKLADRYEIASLVAGDATLRAPLVLSIGELHDAAILLGPQLVPALVYAQSQELTGNGLLGGQTFRELAEKWTTLGGPGAIEARFGPLGYLRNVIERRTGDVFKNPHLVNDFNPAQYQAALYVHDLIERLTNDAKPDKRLAALVLAHAGHLVTDALMRQRPRLARSYIPIAVPGVATVLLTSSTGTDYTDLRKRFERGQVPSAGREPIDVLIAADLLPTGHVRLRDARASHGADLGQVFGTDAAHAERVITYDPLTR